MDHMGLMCEQLHERLLKRDIFHVLETLCQDLMKRTGS